ncbi:MAG: CidA/LrgA family protein [Tissierella sp.]|nr:CidA/LrgA family protein [Tissierella sp.]
MKYIGQLAIILTITFLGEALNNILPLPVPGSIYGFLIMLLCLQFKIIKLNMVKEVGNFLLDIMSVMFVPAAVGLIVIWADVSQNIVEIFLICVVTTVIVMVVTGKVTDLVLRKSGGSNERSS